MSEQPPTEGANVRAIWSDKQVLELAIKAGFTTSQMTAMFRDVGPYEITEPRPAFRAFLDSLPPLSSSGGASAELEEARAAAAWNVNMLADANATIASLQARLSPEPSGKARHYVAMSYRPDAFQYQVIGERIEGTQLVSRCYCICATEETAERIAAALNGSAPEPGDKDIDKGWADRLLELADGSNFGTLEELQNELDRLADDLRDGAQHVSDYALTKAESTDGYCKHDDGDCHADDPCDDCPVYKRATSTKDGKP